MLRLGFVGSGFVARFHTRALEQVRGAELCGLLDRSGSTALAAYAHDLGVGSPTIYANIAEMAKHVDAIAILCPNYARTEAMQQIAAARQAGAELKGVMCEKPLGRTVAEAKQMVSLAEAAELPTAYLENQIFMPGLRAQLEQLRPLMEKMGPIALTRSAEEHGGPHEPWFWDPTQQGGGVLSDMGCHSIAVGLYALTPPGKPLDFLQPVSVTASVALLKWGREPYRTQLRDRHGVDYSKTPAEDFATGVITYRNPETGQNVISQFTDSWMFDKVGLRLSMDGLGPGYSFEVNTLISPDTLFISDAAAEAVRDAELALEKSQASRGLLTLQHNEPELYGYVDEQRDAYAAFEQDEDGFLPWEFGVTVARLVNAAYLSAEEGMPIYPGDEETLNDPAGWQSLIAQGGGVEQLL